MYLTRDRLAMKIVPYASLALSVLALAACADAPAGPEAAGNASFSSRPSDSALARTSSATGAVYTLTNATDGNAVVAFHRAQDGSLTSLGSFATGGRGTGGTIDPLTSQFAVVVNESDDALFAV